MGGEGTIYLREVLPAPSLCTGETSSWDCFTLVGGAYLRIFCDERKEVLVIIGLFYIADKDSALAGKVIVGEQF